MTASIYRGPTVGPVLPGRPAPSRPRLSPGADILGGPPSGLAGRSQLLGSFEKGGTVAEDGAYKLEKGEKVVPAKQGKRERNSEYRRVYLSRKKKG